VTVRVNTDNYSPATVTRVLPGDDTLLSSRAGITIGGQRYTDTSGMLKGEAVQESVPAWPVKLPAGGNKGKSAADASKGGTSFTLTVGKASAALLVAQQKPQERKEQ